MAISLEAIQETARRERAREHADIWAAIEAIIEAINSGGAVPDAHTQQAQAALLRAGRASPGDFPDAQLAAMAEAAGTREWRPDMGEVYAGELLTYDGGVYVVLEGKGHVAQAGWTPGSEGGRTLFRLIRDEPDPLSDDVLDFMWGERVPFGARRRDPQDGKVYTPVKESGVTLYEPHHPHMVPSEYKLVEDAPPVDPPVEPPENPEQPDNCPAWDSLEDDHAFAVGDRFTDGGKTWEVKRAFNRQDNWRPPALAGDFYAEISGV